MTARRLLIDSLLGLLAGALFFALVPAAAMPHIGAAKAKAPKKTEPHFVVGLSFAELLGRPLNHDENFQINSAMDQLVELAERPQNVSWVSDIISRNEILPVICLYGRASAQLPKIGNITIGGVSGNIELIPCIMLNALNPFNLNPRDFRSYVMKGVGFGPTTGYGGLSGGMLIGAYMGPKNLTKPMIGAYYYGRYTLQKGLGRLSMQFAYGTDDQMLVLAGGGVEFSFSTILDTLKILPKIGMPALSDGGKQQRVDVGVIVNIFEFPWFERLLNQVSPAEAFADVDQYIAQK